MNGSSLSAADERTRWIVRVRDEHDPRLRRDGARHRVEVVSVVAGRHFDAAGADRLDRERINRKGMLRIDGFVVRA